MFGMLDPVTLAALGVGLMTATGFLLVAAAVEGPSSRRFVRRLQAVRSQRPGAASGETKTRSLSRRDNATLTDRLAQRWLPRVNIEAVMRLAPGQSFRRSLTVNSRR